MKTAEELQDWAIQFSNEDLEKIINNYFGDPLERVVAYRERLLRETKNNTDAIKRCCIVLAFVVGGTWRINDKR